MSQPEGLTVEETILVTAAVLSAMRLLRGELYNLAAKRPESDMTLEDLVTRAGIINQQIAKMQSAVLKMSQQIGRNEPT